MTPERRAELEAELAADDSDDDDGDEVEIGHGDKSFRGSYRRARGVARAWGIKLDPDPAPDPEAKPAKGGDKVTQARFGRRIS
jgi:hypothetical protein